MRQKLNQKRGGAEIQVGPIGSGCRFATWPLWWNWLEVLKFSGLVSLMFAGCKWCWHFFLITIISGCDDFVGWQVNVISWDKVCSDVCGWWPQLFFICPAWIKGGQNSSKKFINSTLGLKKYHVENSHKCMLKLRFSISKEHYIWAWMNSSPDMMVQRRERRILAFQYTENIKVYEIQSSY